DSYLLRKEELKRRVQQQNPVNSPAVSVPAANAKPKNAPKNGLTYKEERELEKVEERIAFLEEEIARLEGEFSDPEFFKTRSAEAAGIQKEISAHKEEYESLCLRWEELESKRSV
ncbi:MAG: hypothetical protein J6S58_01160, partial [Lentisphaeria bacterium]|nr:hypothetical protein [Lentisphaeria bacterium]